MSSLLEWIEYARQRFDAADLYYGHGTDNSHDEAVWLVLHALGESPQDSRLTGGETVSPDIEPMIIQLVEARINQRVPAAYLTGTAWFAGLEFLVTPDVLVPRSPLAELIHDNFEPWFQSGGPQSILEIGTGSGCIAIACAVQFEQASVCATDISDSALNVARTNVKKHALTNRVKLVQSDVYESLVPGPFDLIVSNPPYVPHSVVEALPDEYRAEPELGLRSGSDGLDIPLRILQGAPDYLGPKGILVCEVGESQDRLQEALPNVPFVWLEFESGGEGVFLLEKDNVDLAAEAAAEFLKDR